MRLRNTSTCSGALLGFAVDDVPPQGWIVAAQFEPVGIVLAVLCCCVRMCAFSAAQLDDNPIPLFTCHNLSLPRMSSAIV